MFCIFKVTAAMAINNGGNPSTTADPVNGNTTQHTVIDQHHPLFLHPSDTPGSSLISVKLIGPENYSLWSSTMHISLLGKSKLGFVDGKYPNNNLDTSFHDLWVEM